MVITITALTPIRSPDRLRFVKSFSAELKLGFNFTSFFPRGQDKKLAERKASSNSPSDSKSVERLNDENPSESKAVSTVLQDCFTGTLLAKADLGNNAGLRIFQQTNLSCVL
jgi:hypothetical protein